MSTYYRDKLGTEQKRIYQRMINGENIFLTGNAGTGKSFLVEAFNEYCEENDIKLLKAAPTGIAACNIKGVTLHRLFGLKTDVRSMLSKVKGLTDEVRSKLNLCSVILIDEISMVRLDVFDKIMQYIELANRERRNNKRSPIQLILVGDFFQLAPVVPPEDKKILDLHYGCDVGNAFAFQSKYWQSLCIQFEKLTEVRRQDGDKAFCTALDKCKEGDTDCLSFFYNNVAKKEIENAIWVVGKNDTAYQKNLNKLDEISGETYVNEAVYSGTVTDKDKLCEDKFICKVGARVLMLVNDPIGLYQNGSIGTIVSVNEGYIIVDIDKKDESGNPVKPTRVFVEPHEFCKYEYQEKKITVTEKDERGKAITRSYMDLALVEIGKAVQYPMKLGFAVTVHKAQGQTYDEMNFTPEIFQDGQLYVALSRCRFADRLFISSPLSKRMVRTSEEVLKYYLNPDNYSFFGTENDVISVQTYRECEGAVKLLTDAYKNHKEEILDFLQALEKQDKRQGEQTAPKKRKRKKKEIAQGEQLTLFA